VAAEVRELGGEAVANYEDAADRGGAARLIQAALASYGQLDVLVNNAGILRDRMLVNMTEDDWDGVIRTHLRGVFAPPGTPPRTGGSGPRPGRLTTPGSFAPRPRPVCTGTQAR
jgi:NAD(P)-dependent dehydrogenase (short-subunit alcohol dehydrogenase family)